MIDNKSDTTLTIPAAIAALPLTLNEKIVLAEIAGNPKCGSEALAKLLGVTERGINKTVNRLQLAGYLQQLGSGRARQLYVTFSLELGTEFSKQENPSKLSNGELCSDLHPVATSRHMGFTAVQIPLDEYFEQTMRTMDQMTRWPSCCPLTFVRLLQPLIERVQIEMGDGPEKEAVLRDLTVRHGAFIAMSMGVGLPNKIQRRLNERIANATPEQLIEFRRRAMAGKLKDKTPLEIAAWCSEEGAR
jgi:DNA-binding MarR family transcriptional regulator